MNEIYVYQMGKVGSVALVDALRAVGIEAAQTHFLGLEHLQDTIKTLIAPGATPHSINHGTGQLLKNIGLTHEINRKRQQRKPVRLISMVRDPLDWYWSDLVQNIDGYKTQLIDPRIVKQFEELQAADPASRDEEHFRQLRELVLESMLNKLETAFGLLDDALPADCGDAGMQPAVSKYFVDHVGPELKTLHGFAMRALRPILWPIQHLNPLMKIDLYQDPLPPDGTLRLKKGLFDLLVIKYESMRSDLGPIERFVGKPIVMEHKNVTEGKQYASLVRDVRQHAFIPDRLLERLYGTEYARFFGYSLPQAIKKATPSLVLSA